MKKKILLLLLNLAPIMVFSQTAYLRQYSSFCSEFILDETDNHARGIVDIYTENGWWRIDAVIVQDCGVKLYPTSKVIGDTLFIKTFVIERETLILENGDTIMEFSEPEECSCPYSVKMEFNLRAITQVNLNGKVYPLEGFKKQE